MWRDNNDTRRFIKSIDTEVTHLTRAQCCPLCLCESSQNRREREREREREMPRYWEPVQSVVRTRGHHNVDCGVWHWHRDPETNPCLDTTLCWGPGPARLCNAQILSVIKIFYIPAKSFSSQIALTTDTLHSHSGARGQCQPVIFSESLITNNSNHLFSVLGWAWLTQVMTACDVLWRPVMTTCTCHQALSPVLVSSADNISCDHNILLLVLLHSDTWYLMLMTLTCPGAGIDNQTQLRIEPGTLMQL